MAKKSRTEALITKEEILNAAETLFLKNGVSHTSLHQIAVRAGVTRGAIYWHFTGKVDLLQSLLDRAVLPFDEQTTLIYNDPTLLPEEKIIKIASQIAHLFSQNIRARNAIEIITYKAELVDEFSVMYDAHMKRFTRIINIYSSLIAQEYQRRKLPSTNDEINASAHAIYAILTGLFHNWLLTNQPIDIQMLSTHTVKTYLQGLWISPSSL